MLCTCRSARPMRWTLAMLQVHIHSAAFGVVQAQPGRRVRRPKLPPPCLLSGMLLPLNLLPTRHPCLPTFPMPLRFFKGLLGFGPRLSMISVHPNGAHLASIARLLSAGTLRPPRISATFPLERAGEAHAFLEGARGPRPPGKVVLQVAPPVLAEKDG